MITLNDRPVLIGSFPDGTILMKEFVECYNDIPVTIGWRYENDREFLALMYLVKHIRNVSPTQNIKLYMPYIPNARMDRVKNEDDVFTLKYFAELLNSLELDSVTVLDPHSSVSEALINNLVVLTPEMRINYILESIPIRIEQCVDPRSFEPQTRYSLTMFYPDEGAMKRYSGMINLPYAYGLKKRDWETGKILGLDVAGEVDKIAGKDILIVDDICSRGGTFYHAAKKLKELGARRIYLFVSHCENTILEGDLLTSGLIERVYTTDSIFTKSHEKVEVLK